MPPEDTTGSTDETSGQEQQGQQQTPGTEPGQTGQQQASTSTPQEQTPSEPIKLPDDHPLVKTLATQKQQLTATKAELAELRAKSAQVTQLEEDLKARPTTEALETLQTRYDRLEAFLQAAGGPLGKALDSRSFTRDLFETDKNISDLVKAFNAANPTATSTALGSGGAAPAATTPDMNTLLRAAIRGR